MLHHLHYCRFSDSVVTLDPISNRYYLLKGDAADRFLRLAEGKAYLTDNDWLAKQGIDPTRCSPPATLVAPVASALDRDSQQRSRFTTFQAVWYQARYQRHIRTQPLHQLLDALMENRPCSLTVDDQRLTVIVAGFVRARRFISAHHQCLPRALAMTHLLFRSGIDVRLVFGVTMPFAAHCWVQQDNIVLSDPLDRVLPFRPIMVL